MTSSKEAACLGAAILAGYAVGIFDSIEKACDSMVEVIARYEPSLSIKLSMITVTRSIRRCRRIVPNSLRW